MSPAPDLSAASDQEIVALARQGGRKGIASSCAGTSVPCSTSSVAWFATRELAEELTQDTFVKVIHALDQYRPELKFSPWILRIANNAAIQHARRKELETIPLGDSVHATPPRHIRLPANMAAERTDPTPARADAERLRPALEQAIRQLRSKYRRCITLRVIEERSYDDIAEIMDLPLGTVKGYLHRAKKELRDMLGHPPIRLSAYPPIRLSAYSVYPSIRLSVYPPIRLSAYPSIRLNRLTG